MISGIAIFILSLWLKISAVQTQDTLYLISTIIITLILFLFYSQRTFAIVSLDQGGFLFKTTFNWHVKILFIIGGSLLYSSCGYWLNTNTLNQSNLERTEKSTGFIFALLDEGISAPISEELCFRGILYIIILSCSHFLFRRTRWWRDRLGLSIFILFSPFIFALMHVHTLNEAGIYFISGTIYTFLFLITRDIKVPIITHAIFNIIPLLKRYELEGTIIWTLLILGICWVVLLIKKIESKE